MKPAKLILDVYSVAQSVMAVLFGVGAIVLTVIAARVGWMGLAGSDWDSEAAQDVIEAIGLLAAAVASLQISQTIAEEEVVREMHVSAPTRVRRFLSRFLVVLVVALVIEGLVATLKGLHENLGLLVYASLLIAASGVLLACWGAFLWFNVPAERLEPKAMQEAKEEDEKLR